MRTIRTRAARAAPTAMGTILLVSASAGHSWAGRINVTVLMRVRNNEGEDHCEDEGIMRTGLTVRMRAAMIIENVMVLMRIMYNEGEDRCEGRGQRGLLRLQSERYYSFLHLLDILVLKEYY